MKNEQAVYTIEQAREETGFRLYHNFDWETQEEGRRAFEAYTRQCADNATFTSDEIDQICSELDAAE